MPYRIAFMTITHERELTVPWGESDPFGLVYFPRMLAWFNDTEHDLLRKIGFPTEQLIRNHRTAFVMGKIDFKFVGPAAYGNRVMTKIQLDKISRSTLQWKCTAENLSTNEPITNGLAIRIYAKIKDDGNLKSEPIPQELIDALNGG